MQCASLMRVAGAVAVLTAAAACSPYVPDSGAEYGAGPMTAVSDTRYRAPVVPAAGPVATQTLGAAPGSDDIAGQTAAVLAGSSVPGPSASPDVSMAGLSDENDFAAVAARESIESDAARLERQRAAFEIVEPTAVPQRSGSGSPNIVTYALDTSRQLGMSQYTRLGVAKSARADRNCARFRSDDRAQTAFLEKGGPRKDPMGLDPDGDGFACGWNPATFRLAVAG
ncbi:hypothetical protein [Chachezhania antarctica]|uniref:hypothetical protein n=1 Tax=Chachezhania antarctica TaxID=2340860 RepID=UPI001F08B61B|nr:hypothetical protein [Chachezhania antarctica]|tara:strand:+ start:10841 stop:11518 length:678 start_codon:yes stop_codon:yes gene_type:complete